MPLDNETIQDEQKRKAEEDMRNRKLMKGIFAGRRVPSSALLFILHTKFAKTADQEILAGFKG